MHKTAISRARLALATLLVTLFIMGSACNKGVSPPFPAPGTTAYNETLRDFFTGTLALKVGDKDKDVDNLLEKAKELAPGEPAIWLNLALKALTLQKTGEATEFVNTAKKLAPDAPEVSQIEGLVLEQDGKLAEAKKAYDTYLAQNPSDLQSLFSQQKLIDQLQEPDSDKKRIEILDKVLTQSPGNIYVLVEAARTSVKLKDTVRYKKYLDALIKQSSPWPADIKAILEECRKAPLGLPAAIAVAHMNNSIRVETFPPGYFAKNQVEFGDGATARLPIVDKFLKMKNPSREPAEPDTALTYTSTPLGDANTKWDSVQIVPFDVAFDKKENYPGVFGVSLSKCERLDVKSTSPVSALPGARALLPIALDREHLDMSITVSIEANRDRKRDYKNDLVALVSAGAQVFGQASSQGSEKDFAPGKVIQTGAITNAFAADIELDGDLDVILSTQSKVITLLNTGKDTYSASKTSLFSEVKGAKSFSYGDLDGEGTPEAVFADTTGQLFLYKNLRSGYYALVPQIANTNNISDLAIFDAKNSGKMAVILLKTDGTITRVFTEDRGTTWKQEEVAKSTITEGKILIGDLDNNGAMDIIVAGKENSQILLANSKGEFTPLPTLIPARITGVGDLKMGGFLALVGVDTAGKALEFDAKPTKNYPSLIVRTSAEPTKIGDDRINPFGVGSELEMRAGLLWQKQIITGPQTHFGLGTQSVANAVRAVWTNGSTNAIFDGSQNIALRSNTNIEFPQPLIGSCPLLFAWDGKQFSFVTDCIWRSPLGLKINAQDTASVSQTEDWLKIRGDQLKAKDGFYDLRITAELWETHFFDHVNLRVVDHPRGTDVFVDERFAIPAPPLKIYATKVPQAIERAVADTGEDVTALVKERDLQHVDTFGRGQYQGVTRDHFIEITLPDSAPKSVPVYLIANGWIHPTDTSINVAIGQRPDRLHPSGLVIETQDSKGNWNVARLGLGFPEGKVKTILLRLDDLWQEGQVRKLRLRTNLEIYWDQIQWAEGLPDATYKTTKLTLTDANLSYRGFSQMQPFRKDLPEIPTCYAPVASRGQKWRDLEGNYTRYGDVRPLLTDIDDRYVIMNAGDEMHIRFPEAAPPAEGMVRDYVFIGDGWVKDGNYNTTFSRTVMPLPLHRDTSYKTPPGALTDDPAYKLHPSDWEQYHTRYVSPSIFEQGLRP